MAGFWLFSYGTLSDPEYIQLLLNRLPVYAEAFLPDYELLVHPLNGYLFVRPCDGEKVSGFLFEVSARELELIDLWEEVPVYRREMEWVTLKEGGRKQAFVYTQNQATGLLPDEQKPKPRQQIVQEINDFVLFLQKSGWPR